MDHIYNFVKKEYSAKVCYPPFDQIFNAFKMTSWEELKVVIIGQDPYPNVGEAMGLCFSVNRNIKIPKSLLKIYDNLEKDDEVQFTRPKHGDLTKWAEQGVLLLNSTLTVEHKLANSHQKASGWDKFTDYVIKKIDSEKKGIVYLLWGNFAIKKKNLMKNKDQHHIIENIHPSPLAASKGDFSKSKQFSEVNKILKQQGKKEIDWNLD